MIAYLFLAIGVILEVTATCCLKLSAGFTKLIPSLGMLVCYPVALFFASLAIERGIPLSIAYALWSGAGIALIVLAGFWLFEQKLDFAAYLGIGLIVCGIVVMQAFSKTSRFFDS